MPSSEYLHPEFGFFGATPRWRRHAKVAVVSALLGAIAGAGSLAVLIADRDLTTGGTSAAPVQVSAAPPGSEPDPAAQAPAAKPRSEASPPSLPATAATPSPMDGADTARLDTDGTSTDGKSTAAKPDATDAARVKAACDTSTWASSTWAHLDGKCVAQDKPRKRVRAANDNPAIGRTPVGRSPAPSAVAADGADDPQSSAPPSSAAPAAPADGAAPAEPTPPAAAPAKKPQRTARSHNRRRDQDRIDAHAGRDLRADDDWDRRGDAGYRNERSWRGGYGSEDGRYVRDGFWGWSR